MWRFGFIGDILRWMLDLIYSVVPNYAIAILIFVVIIRLLIMPLDVKSRRGMRRTMAIQPKIKEIEKKYGGDKERLSRKMNDLYQKEKINPFAGCLPMLLSMPILFAMFAVMRDVANLKTVEMIFDIKNALEAGVMDYVPEFESFLWIKNVFMPDSFTATVVPAAGSGLIELTAFGALTQEMIDEARAFVATDLYRTWTEGFGNNIVYSAPMILFNINVPQVFNGWFVLPVLSAVTQLLASKLLGNEAENAEAKDKNDDQASTQKMMKWMFPIISLWICSTSNAGFALYWVAANVIQAVQTIGINKWLDYLEAKKQPAIEGR